MAPCARVVMFNMPKRSHKWVYEQETSWYIERSGLFSGPGIHWESWNVHPMDKGGLLSLLPIVIFNWLLVEICEERGEEVISQGNKRSLKSVWERGGGRRYIIKSPDTYPAKWIISWAPSLWSDLVQCLDHFCLPDKPSVALPLSRTIWV